MCAPARCWRQPGIRGDSGDPCDPYSSAYDYTMCTGGYGGTGGGSNGGTASTCRGCTDDPVTAKLTAMLEAAGISLAVINPLSRALIIARCAVSYGIITSLSDSTCNGTPGGCRSHRCSRFSSYNHDVAYDNLNAVGFTGAIFDLNTLQADKKLLAACYRVLDMYKNGTIDPQTNKPISLATRERAILVIAAFEIAVTEKELRI